MTGADTPEGNTHPGDKVSVEDALALLEIIDVDEPVPDQVVHVFIDGPGMLIGADWSLKEVKRLIEAQDGAALSGPLATKLGHGLVVHEEGKPRFLATKGKE